MTLLIITSQLHWWERSNGRPCRRRYVTSSEGSRHELTCRLGFDPIFFIHHANVDRLLALWSAVNPGVWVTDGPAVGGTWTIPADATVDDKTGAPGLLLGSRGQTLTRLRRLDAVLERADDVLGVRGGDGHRQVRVHVPRVQRP